MVRNRKRNNLRSGGFIVSVTLEGYVTDVSELFGAGSFVQRYIFLARLKQLYPEFAVILHDDVSYLRRFAQKFVRLSAFHDVFFLESKRLQVL